MNQSIKNSFNRKTTSFVGVYRFMIQIYMKVLAGKEIPIRELKMLSSRFSGKSHMVTHFFALLFMQSKKKIVMNYVRARNADIIKAQLEIEKLLLSFNASFGTKSNKGNNVMENSMNKIEFTTLNEEKQKIEKTGGKIGLTLEHQAQYIFTFYEECSQLNEDLVINHRQSVRGNEWTGYMFIYASNPWVRSHWYIAQFIKWLPENNKNEDELLDIGFNHRFDSLTKTLYLRPRFTLNKHLKKEQIQEIEGLKNISYNKWRIVSLGFSGNLLGSLYKESLDKMNPKVETHIEHEYFGGIDWGDGKSAQASASVAYFMGISLESGVDVYAEYEHWNNKGKVLTTEQQINAFCDFYIKFYKKVQKSITVYIDNAALGDFFTMFQTMLTRKGYYPNQIEFVPATKPKNTWERVETVNAMLSLGILRFNPEICIGLYQALENCYEVTKLKPTEDGKRERSHEYTHWIHALEYGIGMYMKEFQMQIPLFDSKSLGKYAII